MKHINVHIDRLGMIRNADISISQLMLFSGDSGLGKSYLAMLCHYFYYVLLDKSRINRYFLEHNHNYNEDVMGFGDSGTALAIDKKEFQKWIADDALQYLRYMIGNSDLDASIEVDMPLDAEGDAMKINYKREILGIDNHEDLYIVLSTPHLRYRIKEGALLDEENPYSFLMRKSLTQQIFDDNYDALEDAFVLPPSRGPLLTESVSAMTGLYQMYQKTLITLRTPLQTKANDNEDVVEILKKIMDGESAFVNGMYRYRCEGADMPMSAAAASIRELVPLEMIAKRGRLNKVSVLIEEPEAHLHPTKQRMAADIISCLYNKGTHMQITTHSDYFLRRINEFIMLGKLKEKLEKDEYDRICEDTKSLPSLAMVISNMSAYLLIKNEDGTSSVVCQNLEDGIPYVSFLDSIDRGLRNYSILINALKN